MYTLNPDDEYLSFSESITVNNINYDLSFESICNEKNNTISCTVFYYINNILEQKNIPTNNDFASLDEIISELKRQVVYHIESSKIKPNHVINTITDNYGRPVKKAFII